MCAVIGKGGEQIASIQSESECKIQFAPGSCLCVCLYVCCRRFLFVMQNEISH